MEMIKNVEIYGLEESIRRAKFPMSTNVDSLTNELTNGIKKLAQSNTGEGHDQWLTGVIVQFDLTCSVKMWTEFQRYHFMDFVSSQSTMHRISKFNLDDQYIKYVDSRIVNIMKEKVEEYNILEESSKTWNSDCLSQSEVDEYNKLLKDKYLEILYSNPCGFKLTAGITTNYRQLKTVYKQRKNHRLPEWREFCKWIETLPRADLIIGDKKLKED